MSASQTTGRIPSAKRPRLLDVVTGAVDDDRPTLYPDDVAYEQFCWAWLHQDTWTHDEHAGFWRWALAQWPRRQGKPATTETLAHAVGAARRHGGLTNREAEAALGYAPDSLARMGVFKHPASDPTERDACMTDYPLPRIYANSGYPDAEPKPDPNAYSNLDVTALEGLGGDPKVAELRRAIDELWTAVLSRGYAASRAA